MLKAEQLPLFEIDPEDSLAVYGTPDIPFLVASPTPSAVTTSTSTTSTLIQMGGFSIHIWRPFGEATTSSHSTPYPLS